MDYVLVLNDGTHGYTLNGKSFPATEPIVAKQGQKVRISFMNEGMMIHPMHLHGMHMTVIAKDGWDPPAPWKCDTLNIAPGERWDVLSRPRIRAPGRSTAISSRTRSREHGMFGMVTALIVDAVGGLTRARRGLKARRAPADARRPGENLVPARRRPGRTGRRRGCGPGRLGAFVGHPKQERAAEAGIERPRHEQHALRLKPAKVRPVGFGDHLNLFTGRGHAGSQWRTFGSFLWPE